MTNTNQKIIFSLRVNIELQKLGFKPILQMPNPHKPEFTCWIYEWNENIEKYFSQILEGEQNGSNK